MISTGACVFITSICGWIINELAIKTTSAPRLASELIFSTLPTTNHTINASITSSGKKNIITPAPVAMPLPPLNNKYGEKQCPITAKTAIAQSTLSPKSKQYFATTSGISPFSASRAIVAMLSFFARAGLLSFTTRKTFVAPMLPLPALLISTLAKSLANTSPKGTAAKK